MKIHYKITLIFVVIVAVVLFAIYVFLNNDLQQNSYQRIEDNLLKQTYLSKFLLENTDLKNFDINTMDKLADSIGSQLNVRVTIIRNDGVVLGDSDLTKPEIEKVENHLYRPEVQQALNQGIGIGESKRFSTTIQRHMLYIAAAFMKNNKQGIIRLSMPLSNIRLISNHLKQLLTAGLLFAFILILGITFFAAIFVSRPIQKMAQTAKGIANNNFSQKIPVASRDEIGDLARAFNYMSEQIKLRIEELTASKSRLEAVLLSMFDGIAVIDSKGRILLMNKPLKDFMLVKTDPVGRKLIEVIRNIEIQEIADNVRNLTHGVVKKEISVFHPEEKLLLVHATPIVRDETPEGAVLVFHDITEIRKLAKIRQEFVANVSHELRTPIASIKGYAETLLQGAMDDKENAIDFLNIIYADSERLAQLIDDILNLSKIESGQMKIEKHPCSLASIVERVVAGLKKQAKEKNVKINIEIDPNLPRITADESRIAQVLLNLVDNAIKYNKDHGQITICAQLKQDFIQVDVSDNGIGIPEEDLPRIFERFYRVDKARSRELGGTGLGLSIVKHIIQAHGGEVFVESIPNQGSTFSFTLPKA